MRAAECALEVHQRLTNYHVEDANLYLKLAIGMGRINTVHVGGVFNRWEVLNDRHASGRAGHCQQYCQSR